MSLPGISLKGSLHQQAPHGFAIASAWYGAGFKFTGVTEKARSAIPDGYTRFSAEMAGIDPNPGQTKTLVIVFD